jgi:EmrB/QacA subfamily drug resistance transporter
LRITPLILAVALFMEQMDSTVIATSLPAIAADLGTSPVSLKLAVTSYLVALAIFIPISGWMADRFGAKNVFRAAIVVFALGSIACAFSSSIHAFVIARFVQGIGGSMMTPVGRLLLVRATPRNELVSAMAWLTVPALLGPITGPPLGGFLTTYLSWHWVFWINVPISVVGLVLVTKYLDVGEPRTPAPIDVLGFVLSALAFSGFVFGVSVISFPTLPAWYGYTTIAVGVLSGLLYLRHARRARHPLLDPRMLERYALFRAGIIGGSVYRIGIGAIPFLLPLMLQVSFGLTPFESGMVTFVSAIGALSSKLAAAWVFQTFGFRNALGTTALVGAVTTIACGTFTPLTPMPLIMGLLLFGGLLRSVTFTGVNAMIFSEIDDADVAQASAINSVTQQISLALGVAVAGAALDVSGRLRGTELALADFHVAFFVVGGISALATFVFFGLGRDAGSEVSGHRRPAE